MRITTSPRSGRAIRRKGQMEYSIAILGIEFIILLVLLFTLTKIISGIQPHFQIAYANAELLRSTIDGLCEQGTGSATLEDWEFPQPKPLVVNAGPVEIGKNVIPKLMIKYRGDPNFLLYYEAFPPPQAFGWEVYEDLGERVIVPLTQSSSITSDANRTIENFLSGARAATLIQSVIIPNIIIGNRTSESWLGSTGVWRSDALYSLAGTDLLPQIAKSSVKYRACGDYTLCMKTKDGIIKLPLPNCAKAGIQIDYMQMYRSKWDVLESIGEEAVETATGIDITDPELMDSLRFGSRLVSVLTTVGPKALTKFIPKLVGKFILPLAVIDIIAGGEDLASEVVNMFYSTESDFVIVSPCKVSMDISIDECDCENMRQLKLFEYDAQKDALNAVGNYKTCWDRIEGAPDDAPATVNCVKIGLRDATQFCRTQNTFIPFTGPSSDFGKFTVFGNAAKYLLQVGAVELNPGGSLSPSFAAGASGWVWPGVW